MAVEAAVVTVMVVETGDPPDGATLAGEKEQAARLGSVPHEKFTVPPYPATGVIVSVAATGCPAVMVAVAGETVIVKSGAAGGAGAATAIETALEVLGWFSKSPE